MGKIACTAVVRNEEQHIAEWLAWQFIIGFDTVLLLDNSSTDRTAAIARGFAPRRDVRVINWQLRTPDYQPRAYDHAISLLKDEFEWVAFFDADEFLVLDAGLNLQALLAARPEAAIAIPWALFGSSGHKDRPEGLITENFLHRAREDFPPNRHVKSIIRPALTSGPLNPHGFEVQGYYVDILGRFLTWSNAGYLDTAPIYKGAKLHHYFTLAWADWQKKLRRGYPDQTRTEDDFTTYDRNEVFDDSARRYTAQLRAELALPGAREPQLIQSEVAVAPAGARRLGIAITTFNRRELVVELVTKIRALTLSPHELVVCDDGSTDGTAQVLRTMGVRVIGGTNRGIAWNKNRGIYYLLHVLQCDVVLLLDDDIVPVACGWEAAWVEAAWRHGHVNHAHPAYKNSLVAGTLTAADPGLASTIPGWALAFNRFVLAGIGYMDVRFGRYGHEHSDLSFRALRTGHGGVTVQETMGQKALFYVIGGGLEGVPSVTSGTPEELEANGRLLMELGAEPVYRHAWRDDAQMREFLTEIAEAAPDALKSVILRENEFASLEACQRAQPPARTTPPAPMSDDGNISRGRPTTQSTAPGDDPWSQLDLGGFATIREIHIHGLTGAENFSLSVSIDGAAWSEIARKEDDAVVGGGDGAPFIWNGPGTAWARFVRVTLLGSDYLHLDQVEVFGAMTHPGGRL